MSTTAPITIPRTSHATLATGSVPSVRAVRRTPAATAPCARRHGLAQHGLAVHGLAQHGLAQHGLPRTVSATSFDVDGEIRAMVRPTVPNYALRRMLVGATAVVAVTFALLAGVGMAAGVAGGTASAAPAVGAVAPAVHVAQPGDTMWSIANTYRGDVDRGRYIDALVAANGGVAVQAGAAILLP